MYNPVFTIAIDLDDTVYDTNGYLGKALGARGHNVDVPMHWWDMDGYNGDGVRILKEARFMRDALPLPGWTSLSTLVDYCNRLYPSRLKFIYLTHRGYHPSAESLTKLALKRDGIDNIPLICIDSKTYPSKHTWLRAQTRTDGYFMLVDDFGQYGARPEPTDLALVCSRPWNADIEGHPRFETFREFADLLLTKLASVLGAPE